MNAACGRHEDRVKDFSGITPRMLSALERHLQCEFARVRAGPGTAIKSRHGTPEGRAPAPSGTPEASRSRATRPEMLTEYNEPDEKQRNIVLDGAGQRGCLWKTAASVGYAAGGCR